MKGIIPALDCDFQTIERILAADFPDSAVTSWKIGYRTIIERGIFAITDLIREQSSKPIIFDGQKFGTDIPNQARQLVPFLTKAGIHSVIVFPMAGPATFRAWIKELQEADLIPVVGGHMTHPEFISLDGGFIRTSAIAEIFDMAVQNGIRDFVLPGNQPDSISMYRNYIEKLISKSVLENDRKPAYMSPGLLTQGGDITESGKAAGDNWYAIVGRAIYQSADPEKIIVELGKNIINHNCTHL